MPERLPFTQATPSERLSALLDAGSLTPLPEAFAGSSLRAGCGRLAGRRVWVAAFDRGAAGGSIGVAEARHLICLLASARAAAEPVIVVFDSAGARLDEGLAALGAFRALFREALECRLAGIPWLALLARHCFGGSSMLACLAHARVYTESTLLAMSGPGIIEALGGETELRARDRDAVQELMGGLARCRFNGREILVDDALEAYRDAALAWIKGQARRIPPDLEAEHRELHRRLVEARACPALPHPRGRLPASLADCLQGLFPQGYATAVRHGVLWGKARLAAAETGLLGLVEGIRVGAEGAWVLAEGALAFSRAHPGKPLLLLLDTPGHSVQRFDESLVLSAYLAHLGLVLAWVARRQPMTLLVIGEAAGGVYLSLASPAHRVAALSGTSVRALAREAVAQVLKGADKEEGRVELGVAQGVVDAVLHPGQCLEAALGTGGK